jgi:hypothetical protein
MPGESRLDSIREALKRHRQAADRPLSWSISGLSHYLEEAKAALDAARPEEGESARALVEEIQRHRRTLELAGLQLQLWRQDFLSRAAPAETYAADARLALADNSRVLAARVLAEG